MNGHSAAEPSITNVVPKPNAATTASAKQSKKHLPSKSAIASLIAVAISLIVIVAIIIIAVEALVAYVAYKQHERKG